MRLWRAAYPKKPHGYYEALKARRAAAEAAYYVTSLSTRRVAAAARAEPTRSPGCLGRLGPDRKKPYPRVSSDKTAGRESLIFLRRSTH
jgi:hypothetical protein